MTKTPQPTPKPPKADPAIPPSKRSVPQPNPKPRGK
jgi:hypothetical protein